MIFTDKKIYFGFKIEYIPIDLNQIISMKQSEFKISISVESYDEKTAETATLPKSVQFPNYGRYRFHILKAQIHDFNEDCV